MDSVNEYHFFHNGKLVETALENMANKIFSESVNAYGVYYDGQIKNNEVEYHAKGESGIWDFDFKWNSYMVKPRVLQ